MISPNGNGITGGGSSETVDKNAGLEFEGFGSVLFNYTNGGEKRCNNSLAVESNKKRKESMVALDNDSMSDDDDDVDDQRLDGSEHSGGNVMKVVGAKKREIKNAREKERSSRISKQIDELRDMLTSCGVVVPKGTKSSVLSEVANYIQSLQQQQFRSEIDRNMLIQQIQMIGSGAHGPEAAAAIRHAAAQNGVWSIGNFDGVSPSKSSTPINAESSDSPSEKDVAALNKVDTADYKCIFNSSGVGMAIASMGGAFMDCNSLFSRLSGYGKLELSSLTIFNLTARNDLQRSFDLISRMITPPPDGSDVPPKQIILRGSMKHRNDLGMSIALVKGADNIAKCFCVTLVKNPVSPFDTSQPTPVSYESVLPESTDGRTKGDDTLSQTPAFTSG